jgi:plastocyanin
LFFYLRTPQAAAKQGKQGKASFKNAGRIDNNTNVKGWLIVTGVAKIGFVLTAFLLLGVVLAGCAQQNPSNQGQGAQGGAAQGVYSITSAGLPSKISVSAGATVTWRNDDSQEHMLSFGDLKSPLLKPGDSWSHAFGAAGTFSYHCIVHPLESGEVVVS